jgi:microcystin-dependent protein
MSNPFVAEIRIFPFNFAPKGWALCDGQLLSISQNTALFSLLGTFYGGDGKSNFALPNLQGSVAMHTDQYSGGGQFPIGSASGSDTVTVLTSEMPSHNHGVQCDTNALNTSVTSPSGTVPGNTSPNKIYSVTTTPSAPMSPFMIGIYGGSNPHNNLQPYLVLNYCIALQGVYPPRT